MQKNNGGLDCLNFVENDKASDVVQEKEVYLVLQRSVYSPTTRLDILSADEYIKGVPDWETITTVPLANMAEAIIFKNEFHNSAKRGATSRSVFLEKVAVKRGNERFTPLRTLFKCTDKSVKFVRVDPALQPGYSEKKRRTRKSKK
jgi:hypothetical protein